MYQSDISLNAFSPTGIGFNTDTFSSPGRELWIGCGTRTGVDHGLKASCEVLIAIPVRRPWWLAQAFYFSFWPPGNTSLSSWFEKCKISFWALEMFKCPALILESVNEQLLSKSHHLCPDLTGVPVPNPRPLQDIYWAAGADLDQNSLCFSAEHSRTLPVSP